MFSPAVAVATGTALAALALAATIAAQDPVVGAFLGSRDGTGQGIVSRCDSEYRLQNVDKDRLRVHIGKVCD